MSGTDRLIDRLVGSSQPVRRLDPPARRAALWLFAALGLLAAMASIHGFRSDLVDRFADSTFRIEFGGALATGLAATLAAFHLAQPDGHRAWLLLPVPPLLLWSVGLGWRCVGELSAAGPDGIGFRSSFGCVSFIAMISLPLTLVLLRMLRHAALVRPLETLSAGALAAAALASAGLSLLHSLTGAAMVLVWHLGSVAAIAAVFSLAHRPLYRAIGRLAVK